MALKNIPPTDKHLAFMGALRATLGDAGKDMSVDELLAVAAQFLGNLIAFQDQTRYSPAEVMEIVRWNIEEGNRQAIAGLVRMPLPGTHRSQTMKERPILFSAPMVRGIREDRKTQTRRALKTFGAEEFSAVYNANMGGPGGGIWWDGCFPGTVKINRFRCPYGVPGDLLWVREAWRTEARYNDQRPIALGPGVLVSYDADYDREPNDGCRGKTRVSIHMPRWASRITLRITDVRVERLQDISEADALAEGIIEYEADQQEDGDPAEYAWDEVRGRGMIFESARAAYEDLWRHINGAASWAANPWVWVVSFERVEA